MYNTKLSWSSLLLLVVVMTLIAIFKIKKWTKKVFREDDEEDNFELDSSSNKIAALYIDVWFKFSAVNRLSTNMDI